MIILGIFLDQTKCVVNLGGHHNKTLFKNGNECFLEARCFTPKIRKKRFNNVDLYIPLTIYNSMPMLKEVNMLQILNNMLILTWIYFT